MIEQKEALSLLLNRVIINCIYDTDDKFFYSTYITKNPLIVKKLFQKEIELSDQEVVDCKSGKKLQVNFEKITNISIPDLPYELSPVFLYNKNFEHVIKDFDFVKIQHEIISKIKRFNSTKTRKGNLNKYPLPSQQLLKSEKIIQGCKILKIDKDYLFSTKKNIIKNAKLNFWKEIKNNFDIFFKELNLEKKILNRRLKNGCTFSESSLAELAIMEKNANEEYEKFKNKTYSTPIEMLLEWPSTLKPAPDYCLADESYANNIRAEINALLNITTTEEEVRSYYKEAIKEFNNWKVYNEIDNETGKSQPTLLAFKQDDADILEIFAIPLYNVIPAPSTIFLENNSITTNAYAILNKVYKKLHGTENKFFVFISKNNKDDLIDGEKLVIVEKDDNDNFITEKYKLVKTDEIRDVEKVLNDFLKFG